MCGVKRKLIREQRGAVSSIRCSNCTTWLLGLQFAQFNSNSKNVYVVSTEGMLDYVSLPSSFLRLEAEKKNIKQLRNHCSCPPENLATLLVSLVTQMRRRSFWRREKGRFHKRTCAFDVHIDLNFVTGFKSCTIWLFLIVLWCQISKSENSGSV